MENENLEMIQEITNFIDYLNENSPEIFSENLELKEGLYIFLEKEGDELVIKNENILKVEKDTEKYDLYYEFLNKISNTEMLNAMKSFNSGPKVYIAIGSPFGIALSGKGLKENSEKKLIDAAEAYFKAAQKYMNDKNEIHIQWMNELKHFVFNNMLLYLTSKEDNRKVKDGFMFYFFHKEPTLDDFKEIQSKFLSEKLFNKDKFNVKNLDGEIFGISDSLSGFNDSKAFLKHQSATFDLNFRINGTDAKKLYDFFRLQQRNKILPNPMPLFVDENELTAEAVKFYKTDTKKGHKEIIEHLLNDREKDLQNYYLIFFHNGQKGSRIVDLDFVPVFRYKTDDMPKIKAIFNVISKANGELLKDFEIENIFDFQSNILNKIFNKQLLQETKNGLWLKYFDELEVSQYARETIVNLFYKYRKSLFDYVYKSKRQAITFEIFYDIMCNSILDDIRHDKDNNKTITIKEKLNIWFSLYNYFVNSKNNTDMVNKIEIHRKIIGEIAEGKRNINDDEEFAFVAGQVIYYLLSKSKSSDRSYSRLEPFLQKSKYEEFRKALSQTFNAYKHENFSARFRNPFANVMDYNLNTDIKELIPIMLAGFFSDCVLFADKEDKQNSEK